MAGWMDIVLLAGGGIVILNIVKPDILPPFLQIPGLQGLLPTPGGGGAAEDGSGSEDGSGGNGDGGSGGKKHGGKRGGHKRRHSHFAYAYPAYGSEFYSYAAYDDCGY